MAITPAPRESSPDFLLESPPPDPPSGYPLTRLGRWLLAGGAAVLVGGFVLSAWLQPDPRGFGTHQGLGLPPCGFRVWFGVLCPSCGSTTSFAHFVRGEWDSAIRSNAGAFGMACLCAAAIPWLLFGAATGRLWRVDRPDVVAIWVLSGLCVVSFGQWGVRLLIERIGG
jgi:4-amino-4-deoxy-L-arabinose transferase-like glycosyltransferase